MKNKITLKKVKRWHKTSKLDKLINMSYDELKSLKNREVISLYIADSYTKTGHSKKAAYFVNKALKWGCPKKLVLKILVSHVDDTLEKLNKNDVICVDDTWLDEDENWTAKGTLAVPYLFSIGFKIIEKRNKAVLLRGVR